MKRYKAGINTELLFVMLQAILYITFLTFDIIGSRIMLSTYIKFSIIILCFCYALFLGKSADRSIIFCLKAGLLFTVISDLFLLVLDYYIYGVITFIVVQQLYGIRLVLADISMKDGENGRENEKIENRLIEKTGRKGREKDKDNEMDSWKTGRKKLLLDKLARRIFAQIVIAFIICFLLGLSGVSLDGLLMISVFYFICIATNALTAIMSAIHNPGNRGNILFAMGMGLFLLCDINVGLFNISGFIALPENMYQMIYSVSSILMWTFYAPSQVLIALSSTKMNHLKSVD